MRRTAELETRRHADSLCSRTCRLVVPGRASRQGHRVGASRQGHRRGITADRATCRRGKSVGQPATCAGHAADAGQCCGRLGDAGCVPGGERRYRAGLHTRAVQTCRQICGSCRTVRTASRRERCRGRHPSRLGKHWQDYEWANTTERAGRNAGNSEGMTGWIPDKDCARTSQIEKHDGR